MSADDHSPIPIGVEAVISRLGELELVFGPRAKAAVDAVRANLVEALAARDRGDSRAAADRIGRAMDRLAALADGLDPQEAMLMRAVAEQFRAALLRHDPAEARRSADLMFERSGAKWTKKE